MDLNKIERDVIIAYSQHDWKFINETHQQLYAELFKMDKWFNKYLDIFSEKMDYMEASHPVQKLYQLKLKQYSDINQAFKVVQHYSEMAHV